MWNGKQECQRCCEGPLLLGMQKRNIQVMPFPSLWVTQGWGINSTVHRECRGHQAGRKDSASVPSGTVSCQGILCRDAKIIWVFILFEVSYAPVLLLMCLLNNIRSFLEPHWHLPEMGWWKNIFTRKKKTESMLGHRGWSIPGRWCLTSIPSSPTAWWQK